MQFIQPNRINLIAIYDTLSKESQLFNNLYDTRIKNTKYSMIFKLDSQQHFAQEEISHFGRSEK